MSPRRRDFFKVRLPSKLLRVNAKAFDQVEFFSYRSEAPGQVACGARPKPERVYLTYRSTGGAPGSDGVAVAIERLPDDDQPDCRRGPPGPPRRSARLAEGEGEPVGRRRGDGQQALALGHHADDAVAAPRATVATAENDPLCRRTVSRPTSELQPVITWTCASSVPPRRVTIR